MNFEIIGIISTILALIGAIFNARQDVKGFYFWIASNIGIIYINYKQGIYSLVFLFVIYTLLNIYAIYHWNRKERNEIKKT